MRVKLFFGSFVAGLLTSLACWWISYPVPFIPPPAFAELQVSEGVMGFTAGRNEPTLVIGGKAFVCYFSRTRGPFGTCLLEYRNTRMERVRAYWYWHNQKWPSEGIGVLMHVVTADGRVLLDYAKQSKQLGEASARESAASLGQVALRCGTVFLGVFFATFFFFRKGVK